MTDSITEAGVSEMDTRAKAKEKEVLVVQDQGLFTFENGDTYEGSFEAKKKDRSTKMHGPGVYTTAEGDIYSGVWDNDRFGANENVTISYTDGSKYEGHIKDWCYYGNASYLFPDGALLQCEFHENSPVGTLHLTDPNGQEWLGKAEQGYGWVNPVNHYFEILPRTQSHSKIKRRPKTVSSTINETVSVTKKPKAVVILSKPDTKTAPSPRRPGKK